MFVLKSTYSDLGIVAATLRKERDSANNELETVKQMNTELLYQVSERDGLITLLREQIAVLEGHVSKAVKSTERPVGSSIMQRAIEHQRQQLRLNREQKESL